MLCMTIKKLPGNSFPQLSGKYSSIVLCWLKLVDKYRYDTVLLALCINSLRFIFSFFNPTNEN